MARPRRTQETHRISLETAMAGVLALLVEERQERTKENKAATKIEVLLANAGLSVEDIVALTRKKPAAVRKTIERGRAK
jgi:hypothetical protein